jgi:hypothetical protein
MPVLVSLQEWGVMQQAEIQASDPES